MVPTNGFSKIIVFFIKNSKFYKNCENGNVVKTIGGSKICRQQGYNNKRPNLYLKLFLGREADFCQNCCQSRVPVTVAGPGGSTTIFFK